MQVEWVEEDLVQEEEQQHLLQCQLLHLPQLGGVVLAVVGVLLGAVDQVRNSASLRIAAEG